MTSRIHAKAAIRPSSNAATAMTSQDPRWAAVLARDPSADGRFVYSVRTTGVYCRPSCGSRRARPENVRFHADAAAAEREGFRACRRCRPRELAPRERQAEIVTRACRTIEAAATPPALETLARAAGLVAHLYEELQRSIGFILSHKADLAIAYDGPAAPDRAG